MSLFLDEHERLAILEAHERGDLVVGRFWTALAARTARRAASPGLMGQGEDAAWWYPAAEYLSDAAMAYALAPSEMLGTWLRDTALSIARRPESDWVGPWYRDHATKPSLGHLETAHLCWGLGTALDLGAEVFNAEERREALDALQEKGITLCRRWLGRNTHLANWRAVLVGGVAVAAAVIGDRESLEYAAAETRICAQAYQPDGSYAESLQYANYLAYALMMAYEAIHRVAPGLNAAGPEVYARSMPWIATSMLGMKPLAGWGAEPRARAVNFNDCGAIYRPSGDVVLQIAARCRDSMPTEAGLARWLFDTYYVPVPWQGPHNVATFGLRNDWGFLTLPFLVASASALTPFEAEMPVVRGFSNGNMFVRDAWGGETVLAIQGGSGPLHGPGHLHGDRNSFVLVHRGERLLVDPGHSCYRNLIHGLESASQTHNTCTFLVQQDALGLQEDLAKASLLEQSNVPPRREILYPSPPTPLPQGERGVMKFLPQGERGEGTEHNRHSARLSEPVKPRGRRLLLERLGEVTAAGSEAADLYGPPIEEFSRFWLMAGPNVLFVVDRIRASQPVTAIWNWLLNHRDEASEIDVAGPGTIVLRRGLAGLKMFHLADGRLNGPVFAYVHDAYHPEPNRPGEGRPASGMLYRWIEPAARESRLAVHAFAVDDYGLVGDWAATVQGSSYTLRRGAVGWTLTVASRNRLELALRSGGDGRAWRLVEHDDNHFSWEIA